MTPLASVGVGGSALVVGAWLFVFPFIAPNVGMPLYGPARPSPAATSTGMSGMTATTGMSGMTATTGMSGMTATTGMSGMTRSGSGGSGATGKAPSSGSATTAGASSNGIVLDHATVFVNLVPGVLVSMFGVYLLVGAFDIRENAGLQ